MTLLGDLCAVYDANIERAGIADDRVPIIPVGYMSTTVHIKIKLDQNGNFRGAETCHPKQHELIPCTVESAGRSSGITPHPLHDKLTYVAGDIESYGVKIRKNKQKETAFQIYLKKLQNWAESEEANQDVQAIYRYVNQRSVIKDLVDSKILYVDENHVLVDKWPKSPRDPEKNEIFKLVTNRQSEALVYFQVFDETKRTNPSKIAESWVNYYEHHLEKLGRQGLDYITGNRMVLTTNHARDIRYGGDGAKLISSNDTSGFTYRGRFLNAEEAVSVGYVSSSKAFNALKWLIQNQGYSVNGRVFVAWGERGEKEPLPTDSRGRPVPVEDPTDVNFAQKQFKQFLKGYSRNLNSQHKIHLVVLDAATPGRMDLVDYHSYDQNYYFSQLEQWYSDMTVETVFKGEVQVKTIPLLQLVYAAFGEHVSDSLKSETVLRLVRCVTDDVKTIPDDLIHLVMNRAGNPLGFGDQLSNWSNTVQVAVAINQKNYGREAISMALDKTNRDRSYLFGRLLAIVDKIEADALKRTDKQRPTTALRYMNAFQQQPDTTWLTMYQHVIPYLQANEYQGRYQKLIGEIMDEINPDEQNNQPLNTKYLTGYYHQRNDLFKKRSNTVKEDEQ